MRVLVTGANRGIGLEFVRQLVEDGHDVIATAREPQKASELNEIKNKHSDRLQLHALDISDAHSVTRVSEAVGDEPIDVLINNAGTYPDSGRLGALDYEACLKGFEVNTLGALRVSEAFAGRVAHSHKRCIVNVTSQMGSIDDNGSGGSYAYRMSKAALNMATRSLARDLRSQNVIVFVIHPGWVQTDMGGPNAQISPERSVRGILSVVDHATMTQSGHFMNWDGDEIAW